jgi:hypothetical protein
MGGRLTALGRAPDVWAAGVERYAIIAGWRRT